MEKIAILGGSFDPIHHGHLAIAYHVLETLDMDKILFIPTGRSPIKEKSQLHYLDRLRMVELAIQDEPKFELSEIEIRQQVSYTFDTLTKLQDPEKQYFFVLGVDTINTFYDWEEAQGILKLCHLILVERPGHQLDEGVIQRIEADGGQIKYLKPPYFEMASREIRARIAKEMSVKHFLPQVVADYIKEKGLYDVKLSHVNEAEIHTLLQQKLSPSTYQHTLGVTETAVALAKHHGVSIQKARLAGLLHDLLKQIGEDETRRLIEHYGLALDEEMSKAIHLVHGPLAAVYIKAHLNIEDEDLTNAIRYHTTGRAGMSRLEKIVCLADYIEPNRGQSESLTLLRELAYTDLNQAMATMFETNHAYLKEKNRPIHSWGIEALADIKEKLWISTQ